MKKSNFKSILGIAFLLAGTVTLNAGCSKKKDNNSVAGTQAAKTAYLNCINRVPINYQTNCSGINTVAISCSLYGYVTRTCGNYMGDINYAADAYFDVYLAQYPQASIDGLIYQYDHYLVY